MDEEVDDWILSAPVPWQRRCLSAAIQILPTCPGVQAVWVGGSLARGDGDRFSDVDLNCLVTDDSLGWWGQQWSEVVSRLVGPLSLARTINDSIVGGFTVASDWRHVDLILHPIGTFTHPGDHHALYDPRRLLTPGVTAHTDESMSVGDMSEFFFYLAGSYSALVGRGELVLAQNAVITLRQWLIRLMLKENLQTQVGGTRRLNRHLTTDQRHTLIHAGAALGSLEDTSTAVAAVFYDFAERAERLAIADGSAFPAAMRATAENHLRRTLGQQWPSPLSDRT